MVYPPKGVWKHQLLFVNSEKGTGICKNCGEVRLRKSHSGKLGWACVVKDKETSHRKDRGYRNYKIEKCTRCGFVPEILCQLDVHHIDGNHKNNQSKNLITLCANCHRLITHLT